MNKVTYLVKVEPEANNSKYYKMIPFGDSFNVEYGRLGNSGFQSATYNSSQWNKKYKEKIRKGYEDQSHLIEELVDEIKDKDEKETYKPIPNKVVSEIVRRLQDMANETVQRNYKVSAQTVTNAMIESAQEIIDSMAKFNNNLKEFNIALVELFKILPRKMKTVKENLAKDLKEIPEIYQREQDLLDVMKGQVIQKQNTVENNPCEKNDLKDKKEDKTILELMGLEIEEIDKEDEQKILDALKGISNRYKQAWRVKNIKTQKAFDENIINTDNKETKLLFHGSRSENWWSIINSGLVLRPNAQISGKMFGYGIYFAPSAQKSLGYTSLDGSYWARGNSKSGFMGLYEVHYGSPYTVSNFNSEYYDYDENALKEKGNFDCLHADSSYGMLRNDEIIIYKENQCTIRYLVELE